MKNGLPVRNFSIRNDIKVFNNNCERDAWLKLNTLNELNELNDYYKESSVPLPYCTWMMEGIKIELENRKINQENTIEQHLCDLSQEEKLNEIYMYNEFMPISY